MNSVLQILFINSIHSKKFGGGEKWMVNAAKGLTESGHRVFLASKKNSEILKYASCAGVRTHVFNVRADFSLINTWRIAHFLRNENIQILVCNLNKDVRTAGLAARIVKTPVVIARHGVLLCGRRWKHKVTLKTMVDGILTNTESIKQTYMSYGWFSENFMKVVYNGIEDKSLVRPFDFEKRYPGKKIIFSAGRLSEQKGYSFLVEAAALLAKRRRDLVFIVAGKGRLERKLNHLINKCKLDDSFHLYGFLEDVDPYIKGCDLFVLPSVFEGMPNAVMEAMATGKAVVATDVNGVRELMVDGVTGVIVPPKNPEVLAEAINRLIDDRSLLQQYGHNGLQRVKRNFTIQSMIENLEKYFTEKLHEREEHYVYKRQQKGKAFFSKIGAFVNWATETKRKI